MACKIGPGEELGKSTAGKDAVRSVYLDKDRYPMNAKCRARLLSLQIQRACLLEEKNFRCDGNDSIQFCSGVIMKGNLIKIYFEQIDTSDIC